MDAPVRYCPSRNRGRHCTRPVGHPGLHRHGGAMWSDASADPDGCPGSGEPGRPAPALPDGFPGGRALCERCLRFIALDPAGRLVEHGTTDADEPDAEVIRRREWFNTHGW
ncbi:hypothetical protein ACFVU2_02940 [Leifsonia sp. NPDC058194]|uniref:hypothetical protein n=1 Tax=Leifsonia sp. NPDC058194 TaxID=3346374 RepID=UPI0036DE7D29